MLRHKLSAGLLRSAARPLAVPTVPSPSVAQSAGLASAVLLSSQKKWQNETVVKLKDELKRRGLSQTGNKSTLISRLTAAESAAFPIPTPPTGARALSSSKSRKAGSAPEKDVASKKAVVDTPKVVADVQVSSAAADAIKVDEVTKEQEQAVPGLPKLTSAIEREVEKKGGETLDVKFPQPAAAQEDEQMIPFVPDNFSSNDKLETKESEEAESSSTPKIMTVASAATHHQGGPSHGLHEAKDAHQVEEAAAKAAAEALKNIPSLTEAISSVIGAPARAWSAIGIKPEINMPKPPKEEVKYEKIEREMSDEEKRGRWWLLGIVAAGLALGGGKKEKKDLKPEPKEELKEAGEKAKKAAK